MLSRALAGCLALALTGLASSDASAQGARLLSIDDYADRLRAMWLGEAIANWTGLTTEGQRTTSPFYTDADWGTGNINFVLAQNPWKADDDTDIEYLYLHLMDLHATTLLTPPQITAGWLQHTDPAFVWVSNQQALASMQQGLMPPETGIAVANPFWLMIDAQLTTELFGALAPGMPAEALRLADLPISVTASGHAAHAASVFVIFYSLATQVPPELSGRDKALWLVDQARDYIPDSSKVADIIDFVRADYLANPDVNNWELTRDRIHARYQANAPANGFHYRAWYESSVNFATGIMALLYGQCDYSRTIQIGTLSGWDSDNPTATLGGLLGLMQGYDALLAEFPLQSFSDRYTIDRTKNLMPDYLPSDPAAEDTFTRMAARMLPLVEAAILEAGGRADATHWLLPPAITTDPQGSSPLMRLTRRSANLRVPALGGTVTPWASVSSSPTLSYGYNTKSLFTDAHEHDARGIEHTGRFQWYYSSQNGGVSPQGTQSFAVEYSVPVPVHTVRLVEGDHFDLAWLHGGWFLDLSLELRIAGGWTPATFTPSESLDSAVPFQILDLVLDAPTTATGVRITGRPGGQHQLVTIAELDALDAPGPAPTSTFDLDADGVLGIDDLHHWHEHPSDLNADALADAADREYLEAALRWGEALDMASQRP